MQEYVGLDVSLEETSICVMDGAGRVLQRGQTASNQKRLLPICVVMRPKPIALCWKAVSCRFG